MTLLLACPFCGGSELSQADSNDWPVVRCDSCGAAGPCIELDRDRAMARWNERKDFNEQIARDPQAASDRVRESDELGALLKGD